MLGILTFLLIGYIFCLPRQLFHVPYSTVVTDRNDELLGARIASDGQWRDHTGENQTMSHHIRGQAFLSPLGRQSVICRESYLSEHQAQTYYQWRKYTDHANHPPCPE